MLYSLSRRLPNHLVRSRCFYYSTNAAHAAAPSFDAEKAAQSLGVQFRTPNILQVALTHKSFKQGTQLSNTRLAALGHRAIELYVSEEETAKDNDNETALETTKQRVEEERLAESFDKLGLHDGAQYHTPHGLTSRVKATTFMAIVGAVYQDHGFSAARAFVKKYL